MSRGTATADYIMEDPREALRLELKVDPHAWVQKYLAHRVCPGAEVLSVGCGPGVILGAVTNLDSSIRMRSRWSFNPIASTWCTAACCCNT